MIKLYALAKNDNMHIKYPVFRHMTNATNEISLELLTVSKDDDSFVDFVFRPLYRNVFSNELSCIVRSFIPL